MYVSEICAVGIFVTFHCWLKNVKSRSKIALFQIWKNSEIWFPKKKTITFFWSKLSKLHKKDPILHVATTFSLKQGETRTSHGPIPHTLSLPSLFVTHNIDFFLLLIKGWQFGSPKVLYLFKNEVLYSLNSRDLFLSPIDLLKWQQNFFRI